MKNTFNVKGWKGWASVALVALVLMLLANYLTATMVAKWINDGSDEDEIARLEEEEASVRTTQNLS